MEHTLAMQIVGGVGLLIGLRMNMDPVGFNKSIFGDVEGIDSGESSAMRMAIGGGLWAWRSSTSTAASMSRIQQPARLF